MTSTQPRLRGPAPVRLACGGRVASRRSFPDGLHMRVWQGLRLSVLRSARDCRRCVGDLRARVTRLEAGPASRGKAAG